MRNPITALTPLPVHPHLACAQKLLQSRMTECGVMASEPTIEPRSVIVGLNPHLLYFAHSPSNLPDESKTEPSVTPVAQRL